jgi:ribosome-binding factor A
MPHRVDKVSAQLREEISDILSRLSDPRVGLVSVVDVDVSPDLANARVRVSSLGDGEAHKARMEALDHARGFVRRELAHRLRSLRRIPEIRFVDDHNIEYAVHISKVLDEILPHHQGGVPHPEGGVPHPEGNDAGA